MSRPTSSAGPLPWLLPLATGLLVAWCVPRVKPMWWFGPLFGLLTAGMAIGLERWFGFGPSPGRWRPVTVGIWALIGCAAVFGFSIREAARASARQSPRDAVAESLIRSMELEREFVDETSTWQSAIEFYARRRYPGGFRSAKMGLLAEILAAGLLAALTTSVMRPGPRPAVSEATT